MPIDHTYEIYPGREDGPGECEALYWEMVNRLDDTLGALGAKNDNYIRLAEFAENAMMPSHSPSHFPGDQSWDIWKAEILALLGLTDDQWNERKKEIQKNANL